MILRSVILHSSHINLSRKYLSNIQLTMKNYYNILGIHQNSSPEEIRNAFKTSAMKYHPDKNRGKEKDAEKIFKEVSEAYEVLIDCAKKTEYDRILQRFNRNSMPLRGIWPTNHTSGLNETKKWEERTSTEQNSKDYVDERKFINIDVDVPLDLIFTGGLYPFHYSTCNSSQKKLLLIPVKCGCPEGTNVKVDGNKGSEKTIFNVSIMSKEHPFFERVGESLEATVRLSLCQFLKLKEVTLSGLDGKPITATLPDISLLRKSSRNPKCMEGWAMIEGEGMPYPDDNSKRGNVFVRFIID